MALQPYSIPVQNIPQRFEIELAGTAYTIENRWNSQMGYWEFDWYDADGAPLVMAMAVLAGVNLLDPYPELPPGGLVVLTDGAEGIDPTLDGLGIESKIYYITEI
jgi:hypothetical protein